MTIFEEIKEGDRIVIREDSSWWHGVKRTLRVETVTKVTKTQIAAGGMRFMRRNGWQYGQGVEGAARIETEYTSDGRRLMTPEEAEAKNRETRRELDHEALAYRIRDVKFIELPYDTLLKLAKVLGMEAPGDNP